MKALILAAGLGSRLGELTKDKPKCLVNYKGKALISYQINALLRAGITDIAVVGGYKFEVLKEYLHENFQGIKLYQNPEFASSNMTYTMFCAKDFIDDDIIISYADIIYDSSIVCALKDSDDELSVAVDPNWLELWKRRFADPLSDAETMKIQDGFIKELGKKPSCLSQIDAQYMGLFKLKKEFAKEVAKLYFSLDKTALYDGKDYNHMYMTSFLSLVIAKFDNAKALYLSTPWLEIDEKSDLDIEI